MGKVTEPPQSPIGILGAFAVGVGDEEVPGQNPTAVKNVGDHGVVALPFVIHHEFPAERVGT